MQTAVNSITPEIGSTFHLHPPLPNYGTASLDTRRKQPIGSSHSMPPITCKLRSSRPARKEGESKEPHRNQHCQKTNRWCVSRDSAQTGKPTFLQKHLSQTKEPAGTKQ
jgi:hypothetical protein